MAWLRLGDTAATYPALLEVSEHPDADESTVDEVFGYFMRVAAQAAQHPHATDYIVAMATAILIAGTRARADRLIGFASFTGLMTVIELDSGRRAIRLLNDPEFVHMKTADVLDFERQRRADNGNPEITVLVRMRDGDACRYCGKVVNFGARTGKLAGTYDHRPPGQPADAERSVVACSSCNASRGKTPLEVADAAMPLLPPPKHPYYSRSTRKWLAAYTALLSENGLTPPPPLAEGCKDLKSGTELRRTDPAPDGVRPVAGAPADPAPHGVRPATVANPTTSKSGPVRNRQDGGVRATESPGRDGTGRVGSARDGTGAVAAVRSGAPPSTPAPSARSRRRGRRGGRSQPPTARGDS